MASAEKIVNELKKQGITHAVGVPDNGSARIYELLRIEPEIEVITVTREGEAFAIASGLYVGGKKTGDNHPKYRFSGIWRCNPWHSVQHAGASGRIHRISWI